MDLDKVGKFIAENRKLKNLTQKELGDLLGINSKTVSKWERGVNAPDIAMLSQLAKHLDVTVDELLAGEKIKRNKFNIKKFTTNIINKSNKALIIVIITFIIFAIFILLSSVFYKNKLNKEMSDIYKLSTDSEDYAINGYVIFNKEDYTVDISEIKRKAIKDGKIADEKFNTLYIDFFSDGVLIDRYSLIDDKEHILSDELKKINIHFKKREERILNKDGKNKMTIKYCEDEVRCKLIQLNLNIKKVE